MAQVKFLAPLTKFTEKDKIFIEASNVRELCIRLQERFGFDKTLLLDSDNNLSQDIILLVDRRNAHTIDGAETPLKEETEIIIMQFLAGG